MHLTSYEKIKGMPILSSPPEGPVIEKMEVLMWDIIKRIEKWVEWIQVSKNITAPSSLAIGVSTGGG